MWEGCASTGRDDGVTQVELGSAPDGIRGRTRVLKRKHAVEQESEQWQDDDEPGEEGLEMPAVGAVCPPPCRRAASDAITPVTT